MGANGNAPDVEKRGALSGKLLSNNMSFSVPEETQTSVEKFTVNKHSFDSNLLALCSGHCRMSFVRKGVCGYQWWPNVLIASLFSLFWKKKVTVGSCSLLAVCHWNPLINFRMPEPVFMKLGMYIMTFQSISTAYFINTSHQPLCLNVSLPSLPGKGSVYLCLYVRVSLIVARQRFSMPKPVSA
jgi:hypothetical protein